MRDDAEHKIEPGDTPAGDKISRDRIVPEGLFPDMQEAGRVAYGSRRDFLKYFGFGLGAAALVSGCQKPILKAIPYLVQPEEVIPGKATHYATTFFDGEEYCSLLVKSRDGRPVKIEGNKLSRITCGGTSARVQASVLNLYDQARYTTPMVMFQEYTYDEVDSIMLSKLKSVSWDGGRIVLLTPTLISPSGKELVRQFTEKYPGSYHVMYDADSSSAMLDANESCFGRRLIPSYRFDKAKLIISFFADFLGAWLMPVRFTRQYVQGRELKHNQTSNFYHIQLESAMSLTGCNANRRIPVKPSAEKPILLSLYRRLGGKINNELKLENELAEISMYLAEKLLECKGESLLVSSTNDKEIQLLVNAINLQLGNYGNTIDWDQPLLIRQGNDGEMTNLVSNMANGRVDILLMWDVNPLYNYPERDKFREALARVPLKLTLASAWNETSKSLGSVIPGSHYLEKWDDAEPVHHSFSICQPLIAPLHDTRQTEETLMRWADIKGTYHDFIRECWKKKLFVKQTHFAGFEEFWADVLRKGVFEPRIPEPPASPLPDLKKLTAEIARIKIPLPDDSLEACFYPSLALGTGKYANNPWLQELPDPVSQTSWGNFAAIPPNLASEKGLKNGDIIMLPQNIKIPVLIQPGQATGTISIALGYGRTFAGKAGNETGTDVIPLIPVVNGALRQWTSGISIDSTGESKHLAFPGKDYLFKEKVLIPEISVEDYLSGSPRESQTDTQLAGKKEANTDIHWGLTVDLNKCTGCGACIIACQSENNIPVVGPEEAGLGRVMHWIRIDRYYSEDENKLNGKFMPVMCQQCSDAPCETACPVSATLHSSEGLNQMVYARCIGSMDCISSCPYHVRRFNWEDYTGNNRFYSRATRMTFNPDVYVRENGVVEKCTFCVQRIQEGKLKAREENRSVMDGEIQPACVQACPAEALIFGNILDRKSAVFNRMIEKRSYTLLENQHTNPSVRYLAKFKNE